MLVGGLTIGTQMSRLHLFACGRTLECSGREDVRGQDPLISAFLWSSWIAAVIFLVICMDPRRLPLLNCVHFGGLVCHLNKELAEFLLIAEAVVGHGGPGKQLRVESSVAFRVNSGLGVA